MKFHLNNLLSCLQFGLPEKQNMIFRSTSTASAYGIPGDPDTEDMDTGESREAVDRTDHVRGLQSQAAARKNVSPEVRQLMREALASDSTERIDIVERFLKNDRELATEAALREALGVIEREDSSWSAIFRVQREIRKKIQDLRWRAESYKELVPTQRQRYDALLNGIKSINKKDNDNDRSLKRFLAGLVRGNDHIPAGLIDADAARQLYLVNPLGSGFERTVNQYKGAIGSHNPSLFKTLIGIKKTEGRIERDFKRINDEFNQIVERGLSSTRRKAGRESYLKTASQVVGVTLREGTIIQFEDPDILEGIHGNEVRIERISFDEVTVYDMQGRPIHKEDAVPVVHLSNSAKMPLGRFKKWIDAGGGTEKVSSLDDLNRATGLAAYGVHVEKGMEFVYARKSYNAQGQQITNLSHVRINDIRNGRIYFDGPVLFQPGYDELGDYDMRESLSLGEFVKWYHRYDVEQSIGLKELQRMLLIYNEIENKEYGIESKHNPPIEVKKGEELRYPDDGGDIFTIEDVETDGVILNGEKKSFPEFLFWVKNNHVERAPDTRTPEQKASEEKRKHELESEKEQTAEMDKLMTEVGKAKKAMGESRIHEATAGTPLHRLKSIWYNTQLLSYRDVFNVYKEIIEFVKRRHERRSKERYGNAGSRLPGLVGTEFERVQQSAETEEVNKFKEAMEHWGIPEVQRALHTTNNKDVAKACIMTLVAKGEMRWDDHEFWHTMNRLTSKYTRRGADLYIPDPEDMPFGKSGEDMSLRAADALWGEGQGAEWFGENTSKFNSQKDHFEYKFKQLENDPKGTGGPAGECKRLLAEWRAGKYVNPQDYEEMIDGAIKYGKMTAEAKFFYMIAGVLARKGGDPHGETLLHFDRIGELNSKYLNQFPMLDFFTQEMVKDYSIYDADKGEWGRERKIIFADLENWMLEYYPDDFKAGKPGKQFSRFMWEKMMMSDSTRTRISKGIRNAENMDHDDAHIIIPAVTPSEIDSITTGPSGQKKYFTNEGYMNAYPGFNHLLYSLSYAIEEDHSEDGARYKVDALRDAINAFIRYDAILDNRLLRDKGSQYARLDERHYSRQTVIDKAYNSPINLGGHQAQLRHLIVEIGNAYGENWSWLYGKKYGLDQEGRKGQAEYERKVNELKEIISQKINQDSGAKALEVIRRVRERDPEAKDGLCGIFDARRPPTEELNKMRENARVERIKKMHGGGHGH